jgi:hypothetical protein
MIHNHRLFFISLFLLSFIQDSEPLLYTSGWLKKFHLAGATHFLACEIPILA